MTLNGDNSEMEVIIEIKIKLTPSSQMLGVINRLLPDDQKADDKTKQPIRDKVKLNPALADPQPSQEVGKAKPPTAAAPRQPITDIPWPAIPAETKPLREIGKIDAGDYIQDPIDVPGFKNLSYAETRDKRLRIMYGSARVNTTWADIHTICGCKFKQETKDAIERLVGQGRAKNKYTAVSRFVKAVSHDVISPYKSKIPTDDDPDAAFKPILSGVINTHVGEDGGKIEGTLD